MMYQFRDKKRIAQKRTLIQNVIIFGVYLLLFITGMLAWSGKLLHIIGQPLWKAENSVVTSTENAGYFIRTKASVFHENDILKKENANLKTSLIDYSILKSENEQLKALFGRIPEKSVFILANILVKPNRSPYDTIIIDVGSTLGILEGQQVFANGTAPIGEVSTVYEKNSLVVLYSNPAKITEAIIDGSNATVELVGRGGGNFEMIIPTDLSSETGTMVILPGAARDIIAIIDGVISPPTDPVKKVILHSPINIQSLKWVQVKKS